MKKRWVLMLAGFIFCAAMAFAQGTPITGEWEGNADSGEGGNSTMTMTEITVDGLPAYRFVGKVALKGPVVEWPWVQGLIKIDAAQKTAFAKATAITFKVRGNGLKYWFDVATTDVTDYGYHKYSFQTTVGQTTQVRVPVNQLRQPDWALRKRLNLANALELRWSQFDTSGNVASDFDLTVFDLRFE